MLCVMDVPHWIEIKRKHIEVLTRDYLIGRVDRGIIPLLNTINQCNSLVTTSSCYGRIVLLEMPESGDKRECEFYRVWHHPIEPVELREAILEYNGSKPLWLMAQSTILHVKARCLDKALLLRNLAVSSGYKYSKILSISSKGITVEIKSTERLNLPVKIGNKILINENFYEVFHEIELKMFNKIKSKMIRLIENLKKFKNEFINF